MCVCVCVCLCVCVCVCVVLLTHERAREQKAEGSRALQSGRAQKAAEDLTASLALAPTAAAFANRAAAHYALVRRRDNARARARARTRAQAHMHSTHARTHAPLSRPLRSRT